MIVRRVVTLLSAVACAAGGIVGCGLIAGVDDPYAASALSDGGGGLPPQDATLSGDGETAEASDGAYPVPDVQIPDDVYTPDANEQAPDAADAECKKPATCDNGANPCCAPAVCNSGGKCVASCIEGNNGPVGCGNDLACCFGERCNEVFACQGSCKNNNEGCTPFGSPCCLGFVCPFPAGLCRACAKKDAPCQNAWECCSKNCGLDKKCH